MMNKALENVFKKEFDEKKQEGREEGVDQTRVDAIKLLMKKLKYTAKQAMDFLEIPADDQSKYLAKL